jgi:hypothetical protein
VRSSFLSLILSWLTSILSEGFAKRDWTAAAGSFWRTFTVTVPPHLTRLTLSKAVEDSNLAKFLASCTSLTRLALLDLASEHDMKKVLSYLHDPTLIEVLTLDGATSRSLSLSSISNKITEFVSLRHLRLSDGLTWQDRNFFTLLQKLPLEHLTLGDGLFDKGPWGSYDFTYLLLDSRDCLKTPKHLTLDFLEITAGPSAAELDFDPWNFDGDWSDPRDSVVYNRQRIEELVEAGEKNGVKVDGTAVQAIKVEDAYVEQREIITDYLRATGDKRGQGWLTDSESEYGG